MWPNIIMIFTVKISTYFIFSKINIIHWKYILKKLQGKKINGIQNKKIENNEEFSIKNDFEISNY